MKTYSIKKYRNKGRNIKKYKKSRRGCRKRSLIGGKTRRYKVFKNTKRRTLGKRKGRRMVGGVVEPWTFDVDAEKLKEYILYKHETEFSQLVIVAFGDVMITNRSLGYWVRADHRREKIVAVACYDKDGKFVCYAIARCMYLSCDPISGENPHDKRPNKNMEEKILFVYPNNNEEKNVKILDVQTEMLNSSGDDKISKTLDKLSRVVNKSREELKQILVNNYKWVEFKSFISSSGNDYRVVMEVPSPLGGPYVVPNSEEYKKFLLRQQKLFSFFQAIESNTPFYTPVTYEFPSKTEEENMLVGYDIQQEEVVGNGRSSKFSFVNLFINIIEIAAIIGNIIFPN